MVSEQDSYFATDEPWTTNEGLMIAFGITAYDDNFENIEDSDYGELKAYYKTWGFEDQPGVEFKEIPTSICTNEQLGIDKEGYPNPDDLGLFYPIY